MRFHFHRSEVLFPFMQCILPDRRLDDLCIYLPLSALSLVVVLVRNLS